MKCVVCKVGEAMTGTATVTLVRGRTTVVFRDVPALICENCGEEYVSEEITSELLHRAEEVAVGGVEVDIRQYVAA